MIETTATVVETLRRTWQSASPERRVMFECVAHIAKGGKSDIPYTVLAIYLDRLVHELECEGLLLDYEDYVLFIERVAWHQAQIQNVCTDCWVERLHDLCHCDIDNG